MSAADERGKRREEALTSGCELEVKTVRDWCSAQIGVVRDGYDQQLGLLRQQADASLKAASDSFSRQVSTLAEVSKPQRVEWYAKAEFWTPVGFIIGAVVTGVVVYYVR
jgi:hypothetical protein